MIQSLQYWLKNREYLLIVFVLINQNTVIKCEHANRLRYLYVFPDRKSDVFGKSPVWEMKKIKFKSGLKLGGWGGSEGRGRAVGRQTKAKTDEANYIQSLWEKEEVETAFLLPLKRERENGRGRRRVGFRSYSKYGDAKDKQKIRVRAQREIRK